MMWFSDHVFRARFILTMTPPPSWNLTNLTRSSEVGDFVEIATPKVARRPDPQPTSDLTTAEVAVTAG